MKTSYRIKNAIIPKLLPVALPTLGLPLSLVVGGVIHAGQGLRREWIIRKTRAQGTPTRVPEGAGGTERTLDEAVTRLPLADFRPLPLDGYLSTGLRAIPDIGPMYLDSGKLLRGRLWGYPRHFHETLIPGSGGTPISAIVGMHHAKLARPGLVIVHGLLNSKRQDLVRVVTMRAFYEWGFNVCAVDLRGFGRSAEYDSVPTGAGGIEAEDLLAVVRYLKQFPHFTSVGLLGFSLGGGTVLNVAAHQEAPGLIDGGVMAISPPINFEDAVNRLEALPEDEEWLMTYHFFRFLLKRSLQHAEIMRWVRKKMRESEGALEVDGFYSYLRNLVAWGYIGQRRDGKLDADKTLELLLRLSTPRRSLARLKVPTFVLHAKDDPLCRLSADDVAYMKKVSDANPQFHFHLTDLGGHTGYVVVHPNWFYQVVRNYFVYWGRWETRKRHPFEAMLAMAERARENRRHAARNRMAQAADPGSSVASEEAVKDAINPAAPGAHGTSIHASPVTSRPRSTRRGPTPSGPATARAR